MNLKCRAASEWNSPPWQRRGVPFRCFATFIESRLILHSLRSGGLNSRFISAPSDKSVGRNERRLHSCRLLLDCKARQTHVRPLFTVAAEQRQAHCNGRFGAAASESSSHSKGVPWTTLPLLKSYPTL